MANRAKVYYTKNYHQHNGIHNPAIHLSIICVISRYQGFKILFYVPVNTLNGTTAINTD